MLWEFMATLSAGLGAAGLVMLLRILLRRLPKSLVPASAGLGMLLFQIYSEYGWFDHTRALLPASAVVVAEIPHSTFYKPWSYYRPPILKFAAVDRARTTPFNRNRHQLQTHLYFFERRISAHTWPIVIDCRTRKQANLPADGRTLAEQAWQHTAYSGKIAAAICPPIPPYPSP